MKASQLLLIFLCCLLSAILALMLNRCWQPASDTSSDITIHYPSAFRQAAESAIPSVVTVRALGANFSRHDSRRENQATNGSGVIISDKGYIATNRHVVKDAEVIKVVLADRRDFIAQLVGMDELSDLALLKIEADGLPALDFADSDSLYVGDWVLAVGNPFQLENTVTAGIVSAKGRSIDVLEGDDRIESFIQSDAAVNPGNSGGALIDIRGRLVGINTAIMSQSGRHEGFAFAIPGNLAQRVLDDLAQYGQVHRARFGAYVQRLNGPQARSLGLDEARGTIITQLPEVGAAASAGLQEGDVLLSMNEADLNSPSALQEQLSRYRPGQKVLIRFLRAQRSMEVEVELSE